MRSISVPTCKPFRASLDDIVLPVAWDETRVHFNGTLASYIGYQIAPVLFLRAQPAIDIPLIQEGDHLLAQLTLKHRVNSLVDGFLAQSDRFAAGNLLGW